MMVRTPNVGRQSKNNDFQRLNSGIVAASVHRSGEKRAIRRMRPEVRGQRSAEVDPAKPLKRCAFFCRAACRETLHLKVMADRAGFEPAIRLPVYTLSRRAPSTTRPPVHTPCASRRTLFLIGTRWPWPALSRLQPLGHLSIRRRDEKRRRSSSLLTGSCEKGKRGYSSKGYSSKGCAHDQPIRAACLRQSAQAAAIKLRQRNRAQMKSRYRSHNFYAIALRACEE
jgi:hypothetical protein